ncbi:MAG: hypothetical protein CMJ58_02180 [Planctomycetaceae bacterium]|nr:hypothetical protein [Planctomycetaceae bacterium]
MLGSEIVADIRRCHAEIRKYNALLKNLEPETRASVANSNYVQIMPTKGVCEEHDYAYPECGCTRFQGPLEEAPKSSEISLQELLQDRIE